MRFHDVAEYFFYEVKTARAYVTGGTSNAESGSPRRAACRRMETSVNTAECCCAYNMLKLARHLYGWNPSRIISIITSAYCLTTGSGRSGRAGLHAVLSFINAWCLEDVLHGRSDVLVLHGVGG